MMDPSTICVGLSMVNTTICSSCRNESAADARLCSGCGATLDNACPRCRFSNPQRARFCCECAYALAAEGSGSFRAAPLAAESERRQLTVLFCDLVGSTDLSARLDPEDLREVLRAYHEAAAAAIQAQDGYIAQYLGDGLLVYFGYPRAYDDSAIRAAHAALGIVRGMHAANTRLRHGDRSRIELRVRIGIHSGPVVVSDVGGQLRQERLALGETPNLAARLQGLAAPDHIIISQSTLRLLRDQFRVRDLGEQTLKGIPQPVAVYEIESEREARGERSTAQATPLVGRSAELSTLLSAQADAVAGQGPVVLLQGEAGIGKSRQVLALKEQLADQVPLILTASCRAGAEATALHPLAELLRSRMRVSDQTSADEQLARLGELLSSAPALSEDARPLLAALLGIPSAGRYELPAIPPAVQRQRTFVALLTWLADVARQSPAVLVVEDLHWADPSTIELLTQLVDGPAIAGLLVVLTARPEFRAPWSGSARLRPLTLQRLSREDAARIVQRVVEGRALPPALLELILQRAEGVPFYVEEMTRALLESDRVRVTSERIELPGGFARDLIPATVQDSLMARLDRLGPGRSLAQLAATVGSEFGFDLLRDLGLFDEDSLRRELSRLIDANILSRSEAALGGYTFRHALVRDTAYQSLSLRTRQRYHALILRTLIDRQPDLEARQPELLAQHELGAGLIGEAIEHWQQAGGSTAARSAFLESAAHYRKALEQLGALPPSRERDRREIMLRVGLGLAMVSTQGFASKEVEQTYTRAAELVQVGQELPGAVLIGLYAGVSVRGDREGVMRLLPVVERQAVGSADPEMQLWGHSAIGMALFFRHEYRQAIERCEQAAQLLHGRDPRQTLQTLLALGTESMLYGHTYGALAYVALGDSERALSHCAQATALAEQTGHLYTQVMVMGFVAVTALWLRDLDRLMQISSRVIAVSIEQSFTFWLAVGKEYHGWGRVMRGEVQAGLAEMREAIALVQAMGCMVLYPLFQCLLAEALLHAGDIDAGLQAVRAGQAADHAGMGGEHEDAELLRVEGELLARRGDIDAARQCLGRGLIAAESQDAQLFAARIRSALSAIPTPQESTS